MNPEERKYGTFSMFTMETSMKNGNVTTRVLVDFIVLSILAAFISLFYVYLTPFQRGYFCDDENIMYPIKKENITNAMLYSGGILIPLALIGFTEYIRHLNEKLPEIEVFFFGWRVPIMFQKMYIYGGIFLFGAVVTEIATEFVKMLAGRLRPSFLEMCKPDFNCSAVDNPHFFVENFTCTNEELTNKNDIRLSFPSGHTSISTYTMVYSVMYLQKRMNFGHSTLQKPIIQFLLLLLATFVALSRIQDNHHHWDDIAGGFILGLTICLITVFTQSDLCKTGEIFPVDNNSRQQLKHELP